MDTLIEFLGLDGLCKTGGRAFRGLEVIGMMLISDGVGGAGESGCPSFQVPVAMAFVWSRFSRPLGIESFVGEETSGLEVECPTASSAVLSSLAHLS